MSIENREGELMEGIVDVFEGIDGVGFEEYFTEPTDVVALPLYHLRYSIVRLSLSSPRTWLKSACM
jgi:hypothetical protein